MLGEREALRLIEPSYWTMAFFTYSFFDSTAGDAPHTYLEVGRSGVEYTDLRVNRAEASFIWPLSTQNALQLELGSGDEFETSRFATARTRRPRLFRLNLGRLRPQRFGSVRASAHQGGQCVMAVTRGYRTFCLRRLPSS
jgi:hypothetical protein